MTRRATPEPAPSDAARQAADRLQEFRDLRARGALCTEVTEQFATEAAASFLHQFRASGEYLADRIALLAEIATLESSMAEIKILRIVLTPHHR